MYCHTWGLMAARGSLAHAFRHRALRGLDAPLESIVMGKQGRLVSDVVRYLGGEVGHVVHVEPARHGIALQTVGWSPADPQHCHTVAR